MKQIQKLYITVPLLLLLFSTACSTGPYSGDLHFGEAHGYGTYNYPDGSKYEGQFRYGKPYGFGKLTSADGKVEDVAYYSGKRIYTKSEVKSMLRQKKFIDDSVARNQAIRDASDRADLLAIEKDRKRRGQLQDFNAFRDGPNLTGGIGNTQVFTNNHPAHSPRYSQTKPAKDFCTDRDLDAEQQDYYYVLADAKKCAGVNSSHCEAVRSLAYKFGRTGAKYYKKCGDNIARKLYIQRGRNICLASALDRDGRGGCRADFGLGTGVF